MNDDIQWITRGGKHIPITNAYMNDKIRGGSKEYTLYHGSSNNFNEFDDDKIGSQSLGGLTYGKGHYFTPDKLDIYGKYNYKVKVKLIKPFIVDEYDWHKKIKEIGYDWKDDLRPDISDFLAEKGYDGTVIMNGDKIGEVVVYTNKDKKIKILEKETYK